MSTHFNKKVEIILNLCNRLSGFFDGTPEMIRTSDARFRKPLSFVVIATVIGIGTTVGTTIGTTTKKAPCLHHANRGLPKPDTPFKSGRGLLDNFLRL